MSPSVDESRDCLHRAGWSVGEPGGASAWLVTGTNGENRLTTQGTTQADTWRRACLLPRELGRLAPAREGKEG
jgi:hypothetical protein